MQTEPLPRAKGRIVAPLKIACVAFLVCSLNIFASPARAALITATITGTVYTGTDNTGVFGSPGPLTGQNFTLVYTFDDSKGTPISQGGMCGSMPCETGIVGNTPLAYGQGLSPGTAMLTIGSGSWSFGIMPTVSTYSTATLSIAGTSEAFFDIIDSYTTGPNSSGGGDYVNMAVSPAPGAPPLSTSSNWEGPYSDAQVTNVPSSNTSGAFDVSFNISISPLVNAFASGTLMPTSITVSGPGGGSGGGGGTSPPPGQTVSAKNNGVCCTGAVGEPVNAGTGNKFQQETDFTADPHTLISLTRTYNGFDAMARPFGTGWQDTWHRSITMPSAGTALVTREDGRVDTFTQTSAGAWVSTPDVTSVLISLPKGCWELIRPDDSVELYTMDGRLKSITTRAGLKTTLSYDSVPRLVTVTGPFGHKLSFTYDATNRISKMTVPDGGVYSYTYDAHNNLVSVTYPDGTSRQYVYENATYPNLLTGIVDELGNRYATFAYDSQGRAISTQHAGGADLTTLTYNANGTTTSTDARGNAHSYVLTTEYGLVEPTELTGAPYPAAGGQAFSYDANGFLASRTDFDGNVTTYQHDTRGDEIARTEAYDSSVARSITTSWLPNYHLPTQIAQPGRTTDFTYDANGNLLTRTVTDGSGSRSWDYTYNSVGQVLTATGPRTDLRQVTTYTYDSEGGVDSITDPLGHVTQITARDADGRPTEIVDPNGLVTQLSYTPRGLLAERDVGGEVTALTYNAAQLLAVVTRPDGSVLRYAYDPAHRLIGVMDSLRNQTDYTLDTMGNVTAEQVFTSTGSLVRTQSHTYDDVNRVAQDIGALGQITAYTYDPQSNLTGVTDPLGHATTYSYDALNRRTGMTDATSGVTAYAYDTLDHLVAVTDPRGLKTAYTYDGLDDLLSQTSPDTGLTSKTYDAAGDMVSSTDARGAVTEIGYDALDRPVTEQFGAMETPPGRHSVPEFVVSERIAYTYDKGSDGIGHLTAMTDATGNSSFSYDQFGHLLGKIQVIAGLRNSATRLDMAMSYDDAGRLASLTYPSGRTVAYGYDADGRVDALTVDGRNVASAIAYQPFGPVAGWAQGNGGAYTRSFDADGRIGAIAAGNAGTQSFTYDLASRITGIAVSGAEKDFDAPAEQQFSYDALNRLTGYAESGALAQAWSYDPDSNRVTETRGAATTDYAYAATSNRLDALTGDVRESLTYDAAGNTLADAAHRYTYDARGRLAQVVSTGREEWDGDRDRRDDDRDGWRDGRDDHDRRDGWDDRRGDDNRALRSAAYGIDGLGNRVSKIADRPSIEGAASRFIYDTSGHLLGEYGQNCDRFDWDDHSANVPALEETIWLGDLPVATMRGAAEDPHDKDAARDLAASIFYISPDQLGAPRTIANNTGHIVWNWANRDPFGIKQPSSWDLFFYNVRLPGQYHDAESGNDYNMYRDYSARLGRYIESDPVGLAGGINTYTYVMGNSVMYTDFWGLETPRPYEDPLLTIANRIAGIGQPEPQLSFSMPNYYTLTVTIPLPWAPMVGVGGTVSIDQYGDIYYGPATTTGFPTGGGVSATAGWLNNQSSVCQQQTTNFLTQSSYTFGAGYGFEISQTSTPGVGTASSFGFSTPGVANQYSYTKQLDSQ